MFGFIFCLFLARLSSLPLIFFFIGAHFQAMFKDQE